jgi:cysteamine dioxygenase
MKSIINQVRDLSVKTMRCNNKVEFLDSCGRDPSCLKLIQKMIDVDLNKLGIDHESDPYYFRSPLNRVTIEGNEDYRLVLFFIKKGTRMPLHDHPNMTVFFKLMFGQLNYRSYDKVENKFKYNDFSNDEYAEFIETKKKIPVNLTTQTVLKGSQMMLVTPSSQNMHEFVAEENTCFFDVCLPNYTADSLRRITYFKEVNNNIYKSKISNMTEFEYFTTPPKLPVGFDIEEIDFKGQMGLEQKYY